MSLKCKKRNFVLSFKFLAMNYYKHAVDNFKFSCSSYIGICWRYRRKGHVACQFFVSMLSFLYKNDSFVCLQNHKLSKTTCRFTSKRHEVYWLESDAFQVSKRRVKSQQVTAFIYCRRTSHANGAIQVSNNSRILSGQLPPTTR